MKGTKMGPIALSPTLRAIAERLEKYREDPDYKSGAKKIDHARLHGDFLTLEQSYVTFMNFYTYRRHMKTLKVRQGDLSADVEKNILTRAEEALVAYKGGVRSLESINEQLGKSGLIKAIDRHADAVFEDFEYNPEMPVVVDRFREMGVPEGAISWVLDRLREADFKIFRIEKFDGSFGSVVKHAVSLTPKLEEATRLQKQHGLPLIEGAGSQAGTYAAAGVTVAVAIIAGLIFGF
jgi:hypothetical protein